MSENNKHKVELDNKENSPEFSIERLYVKDLSLEVPHAPQIFLEKWEPQVEMNLDTRCSVLDKHKHEVVLSVTVKVLMGEKVAFLAEVHQGGIFIIKNLPEEQMRPMLGSFCPNILYPYAREVITDIVVRGGFPQLYLAPVNFDALFQQHEHNEASFQNQNKEDRLH